MTAPFKWIARNFWWLITAISFIGACARITTAAIDSTKVSAGEFIFWVVIAATWMVIQFMAELRARRAEQRQSCPSSARDRPGQHPARRRPCG